MLDISVPPNLPFAHSGACVGPRRPGRLPPEELLDPIAFAAVLAAALMRVGGDRFSSIFVLSMTQSGLALALLPFFPAPAAVAWPWVAGSALLHTGYKLFLIRAYEHGDLSQVYPLARGAAPPMVAVAGLLLFGEQLPPSGVAAVALIAAGVGLMAVRGGGGIGRLPLPAVAYALGTAVFVAAYTVADGRGARLAGSATAFALWMFVADGLVMLSYALVTRGPGAPRAVLSAWRTGLPSGALSLGSYWIVLWALTRAPLGLVAALRETSVLFAMLLGVFVLRERAGPWRWAAGLLIASGVVAMRL